MEDNSWLSDEWDALEARATKAQEDLNQASQKLNQLAVDLEFINIMFEEDLL